MSKQTNSNAPKPTSEECHNAAVRALLHVIDEALEEGSPLSKLELSTAVDILVQQGNLRKWYKDKLGLYNKGRLNELVDRLATTQIDATKYSNTVDGLLRHGSSGIKKQYLQRMGLVKNDQDELSVDHHVDESQVTARDRTTLEQTYSGACSGLKFSPGCQREKSVKLTRRGTQKLYYCDPCTQVLRKLDVGGLEAQKSIGCNNPENIPECEGHRSNKYTQHAYKGDLLCRSCERHRRKKDDTSKKRPAEPLADVTSRQVRARTSEAREPSADVTSRQDRAKKLEVREPAADATSRQVRARTLEPAPASRTLRDRTSVVPDSATSSFNVATPAQKVDTRQDNALLRVLQANNISDVTMLEKSAAMLRLLQANGVSDVPMLEELLHKACQPVASPVCQRPIVHNIDKDLASQDRDAGNFSGKQLEPKLLNKQWDVISEILRRAVFDFVGAAGVNGNLPAELSSAQDNGLNRLYSSLFGTKAEEQHHIRNDKLCKIYHVLWAMLGMVVFFVTRSEDVKIQMLDFVDGVDPRLEILAKSVEQEGRASIEIFQRANSAWVSSAAFAQGDIVSVAHGTCLHWMNTLRPHLQVVHSQGNEHSLVYPARERAFQTELEKSIFHALLVGAHLRDAGGYELSWYRSQTAFSPQKMVAEHENNGNKVFMSVFPGLKRTTDERVEVICKARVVCTCPETEPHLQDRSLSLQAGNEGGDCITVARKR